MARLFTATAIVNQAALEVGLSPVADPYASTDENFIQLFGLLNSAGLELVDLHPWQLLNAVYEFTTSSTDLTGEYDLPSDYSYMIDQTGWDQSNDVPVAGPLSPQTWSYLLGRDLVSSTIYVSFRIWAGKMNVFPFPPPDGLNIRFEYISRNWVQQASGFPQDSITAGSDVVQYEPILIVKFLKAKWLEAKGFNSGPARLEFDNMFQSRTGKDTGAPVLSASNNSRGYPYIQSYWNTPDSGYGV